MIYLIKNKTMNIKNLLLTFAIVCLSLTTFAQNPAGNAIFIDYDAFQLDNLRRYFDCGNDNSLNPGNELTIEAWLQPNDPAWNQKILGKLNPSFNSGYMLAIDQGKIYPEIWNPSGNDLLHGFMPPVPTPYYWVHLAITFKAGDKLIGYINGIEVGQKTITANPITTNTNNLIIGIAPWDLMNFQYFGEIDEVRLWNVARTHQEILDNMYLPLTGSENGLMAYYDFNQSSGSSLPDLSPNSNDGTSANLGDGDWVSSDAVIGNSNLAGKTDIIALWNALGYADPRFVTTGNGLSMTASNIPADDFIIFGHDAASGSTTADIPTSAPANFERATRIWYIDKAGTMTAKLIFNLDSAANGGSLISTSQNALNYTLLYRSATTGDFTAVWGANTKNSNVITFNVVDLTDGYYTIGVGDAPMAEPSSISELGNDEKISVFPNPFNDSFILKFNPNEHKSLKIEIHNNLGQSVYNNDLSNSDFNGELNIDMQNFETGLYIIKVLCDEQIMTKRIIKQK